MLDTARLEHSSAQVSCGQVGHLACLIASSGGGKHTSSEGHLREAKQRTCHNRIILQAL